MYSKKNKKRPSVADGMDKTGWVEDTWRPYMSRGYWLSVDKYYTPPLIPPPLEETLVQSAKEIFRDDLIIKLRRENMRIAEERFRRVCYYWGKRKK